MERLFSCPGVPGTAESNRQVIQLKQANHAPQSLWRRRLPGYAAMGAATLAMALGLGGLMHSRTTVAGTALPLADADAATYGVSAVYQLDDTTYYVVGSKQGFQSEVQAGVTLDRVKHTPRRPGKNLPAICFARSLPASHSEYS